MLPISGILPIVHTPFLDNDSIDTDSLKRQLDWAFELGIDGYCTGMVSELIRLTSNERFELTETLARLNNDRGIFIAGIGAESTKQATQYGKHAEQMGADAVMAIPPICSTLPDHEVLAYFVRIAESVNLPLIVQDASSYVGQPISMAVCVELLDRFGPERILFKPEASPIGPHLSKLRSVSKERARLFDGSGGISLVDNFRRGIIGTMPGMEFLPGIIALWHALQAGDEDAIYEVYFPICALVALQLQAGLDGFLAIEKYVLKKRGLFSTDHRRKPYSWELDQATQNELDRLLDRLDFVLKGL